VQNPPVGGLPTAGLALRQQEDSNSLMHLRGPSTGDVQWRPLEAPLQRLRAVAPQPALAVPMAPVEGQASKSFLLQVNSLSPITIGRAPVRETIVQVDELLCNPPCSTGHGVCARDASGGPHALSGGSPRCFCRSPFTGPTCGTPDEPAPSTWLNKAALLCASVVESMPDPLGHGTWYQVVTLALIAAALALLLTMCWRILSGRQPERAPKWLSPGAFLTRALRRNEPPAEHSPLLRGPVNSILRAPEAQRNGHGSVESWVKSAPRGSGGVGRRRPGLDAVPQVFKDESDEEK